MTIILSSCITVKFVPFIHYALFFKLHGCKCTCSCLTYSNRKIFTRNAIAYIDTEFINILKLYTFLQVCIGTATEPSSITPYLVTLPVAEWPDVAPYHIIIWRPPIPRGTSSTRAAVDAIKGRGGWLACRPYPRQHFKLPQPKVYINDECLNISADTIYWLTPGDVLRLGEGSKRLKIWPGTDIRSMGPSKLVDNATLRDTPNSSIPSPDIKYIFPQNLEVDNNTQLSILSPAEQKRPPPYSMLNHLDRGFNCLSANNVTSQKSPIDHFTVQSNHQSLRGNSNTTGVSHVIHNQEVGFQLLS